MKLYNQLLSEIGIQTQIGRVGYWDTHTYGIRTSNRKGRSEAGLWFRTRGCLYDRAGGCVMCDYGAGPDDTSVNDILTSVQTGLLFLPPKLYHLLVSPIGSFLDEWEVPAEARLGILNFLSQTDHETFSFETRAETINKDKIDQITSLIKRELKIYMGLESSNPWISKYCLNKGLSQDKFENAILILDQHNVKAVANVLVGSPFLYLPELINDAVNSVLWALSRGASECNLFPVHVKDWTTLFWLFKQGLYAPPSLWTYIEVINRLGENIACKRLELSWYKTYDSINVHKPPTTCTKCESTVIDYLDKFDETNDYEWIYRLITFECACKDAWLIDMETSPSTALEERVIAGYEMIGQQVLGTDWWASKRDHIIHELYRDAKIYLSGYLDKF